MRTDGRMPDEKRPVSIETDFVRTAYGSCLIATGNTRVICTASVEEAVPPFLRQPFIRPREGGALLLSHACFLP